MELYPAVILMRVISILERGDVQSRALRARHSRVRTSPAPFPRSVPRPPVSACDRNFKIRPAARTSHETTTLCSSRCLFGASASPAVCVSVFCAVRARRGKKSEEKKETTRPDPLTRIISDRSAMGHTCPRARQTRVCFVRIIGRVCPNVGLHTVYRYTTVPGDDGPLSTDNGPRDDLSLKMMLLEIRSESARVALSSLHRRNQLSLTCLPDAVSRMVFESRNGAAYTAEYREEYRVDPRR